MHLIHFAKKGVVYIVLGLLTIVMVFPFYWTIMTAFKRSVGALTFPPEFLVTNPTLINFREIFSVLPFAQFFLNSIIVTMSVVLGQLFICSLAGYAFARLEFPGSRALFGMLISALLVPQIVVIIPKYFLFMKIGWLDTLWPLIVPPMTANTFGTFLMRQYFKTLPPELDHAALIDGCSPFGIYWRIMIPLARAPLATVGVLNFIWTWNQFLEPLIYIDSVKKMTVPIGIAALRGEFGFNFPLMMAGVTLAAIPLIIFFLFGQKYFIAGISITSGLK